MKLDGDISSWLEAQEASIRSLKAGILVDAGSYKAFERSLKNNPDAARLVKEVLPRCPIPKLASFILVIVESGVENRLIELTRKRGEELKGVFRRAARKDKSVREDAQRLLARAEQAFDTRRRGLADYCSGAVILKRYLGFRAGKEPSARELAALLKAGLAASGRPVHLQTVDYDLLRRNLRNYEKRNPHPLATGERCAQIVELTSPTSAT